MGLVRGRPRGRLILVLSDFFCVCFISVGVSKFDVGMGVMGSFLLNPSVCIRDVSSLVGIVQHIFDDLIGSYILHLSNRQKK